MSRTYVKLATAIALSAGLVLSTAACSSSGNSSKGDGQPSAAPKSTLNQINAVDPANLKQGGILNFPVDQYSTQWNNLNAESQNEVSILYTMQPLLPTLFHTTPDNQIKPNADYLSNVTNALVNGKQTTTYEINPKAKWSNGTPISWKDFQANWQAQNGKNAKYTPVATTGYEQIKSVAKGKSNQEVVITYSTPFSDWQALFSLLYPGSQIDTPAKFANSYKNKIASVTAGPFKVSKMDPTTKVVTEVRDPNWWGTKAVLDSINFRTLDVAATPGAFASGEIDMEDIGPDVAAYKQATQVPGASIRVAGGPNLRQLLANGESPVLKDQSIRQAVFMALNREAVGKADLNGLPWPIKPLNNHFLVNNADGYQDNAGELGTFNPITANQLLDAAGWKKDGDYRKKDGKTLELTLAIPAAVPIASNEAQLFTAMLKNVGIKLNTKTSASDVFFPDVNAGKFDLTVFSGIGSIPFFPLTNSKASFVSPKNGNIGQNYSRIGSLETDAAMAKAGTETDHASYLADLQTADKALWQLAVNLPLYQRPQIVAAKPNVANYGAFGFQDTDWAKVGFTK